MYLTPFHQRAKTLANFDLSLKLDSSNGGGNGNGGSGSGSKKNVDLNDIDISNDWNESGWYYVSQNGSLIGPVSLSKLIELFRNDEITKRSYVWNGTINIDSWIPIKECEKLMDILTKYKNKNQFQLERHKSSMHISKYQRATNTNAVTPELQSRSLVQMRSASTTTNIYRDRDRNRERNRNRNRNKTSTNTNATTPGGVGLKTTGQYILPRSNPPTKQQEKEKEKEKDNSGNNNSKQLIALQQQQQEEEQEAQQQRKQESKKIVEKIRRFYDSAASGGIGVGIGIGIDNDDGNNNLRQTGGYPSSMFIHFNKDSFKDYICIICNCIVKNCIEMTCSNGDLFCLDCIKLHFQYQKQKHEKQKQKHEKQQKHKQKISKNTNYDYYCPRCFEKNENISYHANAFVRKTIHKKKVCCINAVSGCSWKGNLLTYENSKHVLNSCHFCDVKCIGCKMYFQKKYIDSHVNICDEMMIECDLCKEWIKRKHQNGHLSKECKFQIVQCINYPQCLESNIIRANLDEHLRNDCLYRYIDCPYSKCGCDFKCQFIKLESHLHQNIIKHSELQVLTMEIYQTTPKFLYVNGFSKCENFLLNGIYYRQTNLIAQRPHYRRKYKHMYGFFIFIFFYVFSVLFLVLVFFFFFFLGSFCGLEFHRFFAD